MCVYIACTYIYKKCKLFMYFIFQRRKRTEFLNFIQFSVMKWKKKDSGSNSAFRYLQKTPSKYCQESNTFV